MKMVRSGEAGWDTTKKKKEREREQVGRRGNLKDQFQLPPSFQQILSERGPGIWLGYWFQR